MKFETVLTHDGVGLKYGYYASSRKTCIALAIPFGLRLELADAFFRFYRPQYDVVTWESRLILDPPGREVMPEDFAIEKHVTDLVGILRTCQITRAILVGYCSGAGIALAAANMFPQLFSALILVHGDYALLRDDSCTTHFTTSIDSLLSRAAKSVSDAQQVLEQLTSERPVANTALPEGIDTPFTQLHYLHRYAVNYLAYKATDFKTLARSVMHKSLLLTGNRDIQANVESTRRIHAVMRNAQIHVDAAADHYGILREDSKTLAVIWNYLSDLQ